LEEQIRVQLCVEPPQAKAGVILRRTSGDREYGKGRQALVWVHVELCLSKLIGVDGSKEVPLAIVIAVYCEYSRTHAVDVDDKA
jgi:hypothetical protein